MHDNDTSQNTPRTPQPRSTCFLTSPISRDPAAARARIRLDPCHEGWNGVPHGGILMSLVMELAHCGLDRPLFEPDRYPLRVSFRWGGNTLLLGEEAEILAQEDADRVQVSIRKGETETASFTSTIRHGLAPEEVETDLLDRFAEAMERIGRETRENVYPLPTARNCFVCGTHREKPGLTRKFYCLDLQGEQIVFTSLGLDPDDQERLFQFRLHDGHLHPGILAAVLDEAMGWGGFIHTRQGGMTVKLDIDVLRPAEKGEKMLCFGACAGTRGKRADRMFWFSEGGVLPMGEGELKPIMLARGQWLAMPRLTEEMRRELSPAGRLDRWFSSEEGS